MRALLVIANLSLIMLMSSYAEDDEASSISQPPSANNDHSAMGPNHAPDSAPPTMSGDTLVPSATKAPSIMMTRRPTKSPVVTSAPSPYGMPSSSSTFTSPSPGSSSAAPAKLLVESCQNTQGWALDHWIWESEEPIACDDYRIQCHNHGNLGLAKDHCCKCKGEQCRGLCNEQNYFFPVPPPYTYYAPTYSNNEGDENGVYIFVGFMGCALVSALAIVALCGKLLDRRNFHELVRTRETMTTRRRQQRESRIMLSSTITDEDRNTARYEHFVTMFHFHTVQGDKHNITADRIREQSQVDSNREEDLVNNEANDDKAYPNEVDGSGNDESTFIERLSAWSSNKPPPTSDDCCICLESYAKGERVCVPITQKCNHVFHEECIFEWIQKKKRCPLCRVDLSTDCKGVVVSRHE